MATMDDYVNEIWNKSYMNCGNEMKMKKWASQWTQFMQLRKEAWKKFRTSTGFEPVTSRFTGAMLYQLSYEATDVGSGSIVGWTIMSAVIIFYVKQSYCIVTFES